MQFFVVLSIYIYTSLPWNLRSDTGLQIYARVKVSFFSENTTFHSDV